MPVQAESPHKAPRRSRRPPRKSSAPVTSQVYFSQDADLSTEPESDKQSYQPTRILRRGDPADSLGIPSTIDSETPCPQTPPRPKSMYEGPASGQPNYNNSGSEKPQSKKKTPKAQGRKQSGTAAPLPSTNAAGVAAGRRVSGTPNRTNETPAKAYAGPTFHASPAASALPMPKFFSKSVPNVNKTKSLKTMMEHETPEASSGSDNSPSLEKVHLTLNPTIRDDSPLDIFFRADREAKSRIGSAPNLSSDTRTQASKLDTPSTTQTRPPNHARHSSVGVFPLEMDGAPPEHPSQPATTNSGLCDSNEMKMEEQRKAQTIALKKLLYSPRVQTPQEGVTSQRPPSSKLRKEISMGLSPDGTETPELPASPTSSRPRNIATIPGNVHQMSQDVHASSYQQNTPSPKVPHQGHQPSYANDRSNVRAMENDLRRILKLDVLESDGVAGH